MKKTTMLLIIMLTTLTAGACNSVTGEIIDDYKKGKHACASLTGTPGTVNVADTETGCYALNMRVGGSGITHYRYRVITNGSPGAWSIDYEKALAVQLQLEPAHYVIQVLGKNDWGNWQSTGSPTVCSFDVVHSKAAICELALQCHGLTTHEVTLTPLFDPYSADDTFSTTVTEINEKITLYVRPFITDAVVTVNGEPLPETGESEMIMLHGVDDDTNIIPVVVTTPDSIEKTYTFNITRKSDDMGGPVFNGTTKINILTFHSVSTSSTTDKLEWNSLPSYTKGVLYLSKQPFQIDQDHDSFSSTDGLIGGIYFGDNDYHNGFVYCSDIKKFNDDCSAFTDERYIASGEGMYWMVVGITNGKITHSSPMKYTVFWE